MSRIKWDQDGEKLYETGVDRVVLFPMETSGYGAGVPWSGVTTIGEKPSGAEASPIYADNVKYLNLISAEDFAASVEAYTYPDEFEECDGSKEIAPGVYAGQQTRKSFGLCYRTLIGNDVSGTDYGYKIHFIYGCKAAPTEKSRATVNESPEATTMSWELTTTPIEIPGAKPAAHISIDSTKITNQALLTELETKIYGKDADGNEEAVVSSLPTPAELIAMFGSAIAG